MIIAEKDIGGKVIPISKQYNLKCTEINLLNKLLKRLDTLKGDIDHNPLDRDYFEQIRRHIDQIKLIVESRHRKLN